jgi:YVTN family beta-propeller protein
VNFETGGFFRVLDRRKLIAILFACALTAVGVGGITSVVRFTNHVALTESPEFATGYSAARLALLHDSSGNLQDRNWFYRQTQLFGFKTSDAFQGSPPSAALVMLPVAFLSHAPARVVWTWLTLGLWIGGVGLVGSRLIANDRMATIVAVPALLCLATLYAPLRAALEDSQLQLVAFALQSACCWFWIGRRPRMAGIFGGAQLCFNGSGLPLIIFAALRRDWIFLRGGLSSCAALIVASAWALGAKQWGYYFSSYRGTTFSSAPGPAQQTISSFLVLLLHGPARQGGSLSGPTPLLPFAVFIVELVASLACLLWLSRTQGPHRSPAALSICVLLGLIFSAHGEEHSYVLAMTSLLLLLPELRRWSTSAALVVLGGVLLAWPFHLQERTSGIGIAVVHDFARLWGGIALLIAAAISESRRRHAFIPIAGDWTANYAAVTVVLGLVAYYAKPWRDPIRSGPLLAVSQSDGNAITFLRLDVEEREVTTVRLGCKGPFGLSFVRREFLYSSCWNDSKVSIYDLASRSEIQELTTTARLPAWTTYRNGRNEVWISNEDRGTVSIYDAHNRVLVSEVSTGKGASDIVFSNTGSRAWISNETDNTVSVVDANSRRKMTDISIGKVPQGMALAEKSDTILVSVFGSDAVSLIDGHNLREIARIPVCHGPVDVTTAFDRGVELAYVSCFSGGSVGIVDLSKKQMIQEIPVGDKPFGITSGPGGRRIYVCVGGSNRLLILDVNRPSRILRKIIVTGSPFHLALAPGTD